MIIKEVKTQDLIAYENNPRHNDCAVDAVAASIEEFGFKVPIIIDSNNVIIAGHTRKKAAERLGLETVPCIVADDLTDEQIKAFRLADNKAAELAEWDFDKLETELAELAEVGFEMTDFGFDEFEEEEIADPYDIPADEKGSLNEQFGAPPFSVLDTRQAYWKNRKKYWLDITGDLSETRDGEFGTFAGGTIMAGINGGTSNFDPVLAELMYKWFCTDGGIILDPFGGEQTKGVVAGELGYRYSAVEFRKEQVKLNTEKTAGYSDVNYVCGDSNYISELIADRDFDMCFTSPPYYDLEVYSNEDMSALGTYEEFMSMYKNIFTQCFNMMADDTFLVIKIGEIRNKKTGEYRSFVADNIDMFREIGFKYYNEIILLNSAGTAPIRASKMMQTRKIVKIHQNVLVFYKGNPKNISSKFPKINCEYDETEYEE